MAAEGSGPPKGSGSAWMLRPGVPAKTAPAERPAAAPPVPAPEPPPVAAPQIVRALTNSALFKGFTETGITLIASIAQEKQLPAGTPLFVENMLGEALYVIAEGSVKISVRGAESRERELLTLGPGDSLGEAAVLRVGPRLCSATAVSDVSVIEIARRDLVALQKNKPQAVLKLMMGVVDLIGARTRDTNPELRRLIFPKGER